jgi:hypothetical protein
MGSREACWWREWRVGGRGWFGFIREVVAAEATGDEGEGTPELSGLLEETPRGRRRGSEERGELGRAL